MNDMTDPIKRCDPRQARILRNRLHPQYPALSEQMSSRQLSGGRIEAEGKIRRIDPHQRGEIGPSGIRRIDRSLKNVSEMTSQALQGGMNASSVLTGAFTAPRKAKLLPVHQVTDPDFYIVVVPEFEGGQLSEADRALLGVAQQLAAQDPGTAGAVVAVVWDRDVGDKAQMHEAFSRAGADRVLALPAPSGYQPEYRLAGLAAAEQVLTPRFWLFGESGWRSAELGRRLAARLGERAATSVVEMALDPEKNVNGLWCRSGHSGQEYLRELTRIWLVATPLAEPLEEDCRYQAKVLPVPDVAPQEAKITDLGRQAVAPGSVPLAEAEFILAGGNGVTDWPLFHRVAVALGATEGASRVAVDDGYMARATQVGASGTLVSARVYLAVGISGAIQHLQGISQCESVIAINVDPGCAMVGRADLSVIADSSAVLQALIEACGDARGGSDPAEQPPDGEVWDDAV
ncbi:electron transfer flavoprotein subunit alpha/FixB family protein [Photobacterium atrarenae]|uniref:Electron transfer flavoprotein subunit alpha/FixB family protein n=1 Tax=Photobacterium atrarenae TaxID=865757 RepID=A0ABY5GLA1_9GAMM|nr:electron transfer flavoprotein subunit alpha/FixB family protein [Photobacterium atrarenae]UTV29515.1 electron transfer flavoprotein subunit alpha/FixB family protein [Photobacterium atrarenae]